MEDISKYFATGKQLQQRDNKYFVTNVHITEQS